MTSSAWAGEPKVHGQRRQKVLGYIKAANELRQSYQQSLNAKWNEGGYEDGMPGSFPDADIVRSGDEEMLLFPSYARRHIPATHPSYEMKQPPGTNDTIGGSDSADAEYWRREWQRYEDENAVVDVDVRGWIYSPHRGPMNRRNRLLIAVARRLSGIPAPTQTPPRSRESSQGPGFREKIHEDLLSQEEEAAAREAEILTRRGQREAEAGFRGRYSIDAQSFVDISPGNSRPASPTRPHASRSATTSDMDSQKRQSWNGAPTMSNEEIQLANEQLVSRLQPFMTTPLAQTPITIFFYNDQKSQSKSVYTDDSGHFKVRAALDFVPKQVRVLASENLSATEDVIITEHHGISLVSDIDDTIKHSAIASGAKEIFRNTFIKDLGELTVHGVKEWYSKLAEMGVKIHYVSNSPWQLYPLLRSYFKLAGLPSGSFHLKQYSGMLQGIFEPAAERKKGSLDRIMHDFPDRQFILVGDSGEADLEVYTDIVQEHPGRVLAVFIRDVTNTMGNQFREVFDRSYPDRSSAGDHQNEEVDKETSAGDLKPDGSRPSLPERPKQQSTPTEDLIDFSEDVPANNTSRGSSLTDLEELQQANQKVPPQRPTKPAKPSNLRSVTTSPREPKAVPRGIRQSESEIRRAPPPPPIPRRAATILTPAYFQSATDDSGNKAHPPSALQNQRPKLTSRTTSEFMSKAHEDGYLATARNQLSAAYNAIPPLRSQSPAPNPADPTGPQLPPRRGIASYPAAAARWATGASGGDPAAGGDGGAPGAPYDKKVEMWRRRWARAEEIMRKNNVMLRTWRYGGDVMTDCVRLVERAQKDSEKSPSK